MNLEILLTSFALLVSVILHQAHSCSDVSSYCKLYSTRGFCLNYKEWMKEKCGLTCNLCNVDISKVKITPTWTQWSPWSSCSRTCGSAVRTRIRTCSTNNPLDCPGRGYEWSDCYNLPPCGEWTLWGSWGSCTATCGPRATQFRSRLCSQSGTCTGDKSETRICNLADCPVLAQWTQWGSWGSCSATCGAGVTQFRSRLCSKNGACSGDKTETRFCNLADCVVVTRMAPAMGNCKDLNAACKVYEQRMYCNHTVYEKWMAENCKQTCNMCGFSEWSVWSGCSASCGGGTKTRTRKCISNQANCIGSTSDSGVCSYNKCPSFGQWGNWGSCDTTCGKGYQRRSRVCENGPGCTGILSDMQLCPNATACPIVTEWSQWGSWGSCSTTCGTGEELRTRLCLNGPGCPGKDNEAKNCTGNPCPVYLEWGTWGSCSVSCGGGFQVRTRICELFGGCSSKWEEDRQCNTPTCAFFGEWGSWGTCSASCGNGTHTKSRPCLNGSDCVGNSTETQACVGDHCTRMSEWGTWSVCSVTCGNGTRTRTRRCMFGPGCVGNTKEQENCTSSICPIKSSCVDLRSDCLQFLDFCNVGTTMFVYCPKTCGFCSASVWSPWTACTKTCNGGKKTRTRTCDVTSIECGKEIEACNDFKCPGTEWGQWEPCSKTCGGGTRMKTMKCDKTFSQCPTFYQDCQTQPCPTKICQMGERQRYGGDSECCLANPTDECGRSGDGGRVIGGQKADSGRWPWMIYMQIKSGSGNAICGATIIDRKWAITAAHCVRDHQTNPDVLLTMGFTALGDTANVQRRRVRNVIMHPRFNMPSNDIALIEFDKAITITNYVRPLCLPNGEETSADKTCFAAGWGITNPTSSFSSSALNEVSLRVLDMNICKLAYDATRFGKFINHGMMCAGKLAGGVDTCAGDSGGPLMCQRCTSCSWYLAGVTSFGSDNCGMANYPGVYTNVIEYQPWIRTIVPSTQTGNYTGC